MGKMFCEITGDNGMWTKWAGKNDNQIFAFFSVWGHTYYIGYKNRELCYSGMCRNE